MLKSFHNSSLHCFKLLPFLMPVFHYFRFILEQFAPFIFVWQGEPRNSG